MKELKTAKTFDEQLAILESRDMVIDDADAALRALKSMNYYRLTGYAYQFKHGKTSAIKQELHLKQCLHYIVLTKNYGECYKPI
ncbi:MAG: hypothetical protein RR954_09240 [Christensenellaceae bacterium]